MPELFTDGAYLLRIYTAEKDHVEGLPFYEWIVQRAVASGISGATVLRGIGGFCSSNPVLAPEFRAFQINQPVLVEIVDTRENLEMFVQKIDSLIPRGLMTMMPVLTRFYGKKE